MILCLDSMPDMWGRCDVHSPYSTWDTWKVRSLKRLKHVSGRTLKYVQQLFATSCVVKRSSESENSIIRLLTETETLAP